MPTTMPSRAKCRLWLCFAVRLVGHFCIKTPPPGVDRLMVSGYYRHLPRATTPRVIVILAIGLLTMYVSGLRHSLGVFDVAAGYRPDSFGCQAV